VARGVKWHPHFEERFAELVPSAVAREAILTGIRVTIAEDPHVGEPLDSKTDSCWLAEIPEAPGWGTPRMVLMYTFDEDDIWLTWLN